VTGRGEGTEKREFKRTEEDEGTKKIK